MLPCPRVVVPIPPFVAFLTAGTPRSENRVCRKLNRLLGLDPSARVGQAGVPNLSLRGSGWASLALSRRLALGATTSSLSKATGLRTKVRGPVVFSPTRFAMTTRLRGQGDGNRRTQGLERFDDEHASEGAFQ